MEISAATIQTARDRFVGASERLVEDPSDVDALLDLKQSEFQVKAAVKVIRIQDELERSLLDILV